MIVRHQLVRCGFIPQLEESQEGMGGGIEGLSGGCAGEDVDVGEEVVETCEEADEIGGNQVAGHLSNAENRGQLG